MSARAGAPPVGLCADCLHVRVVETRTGARFYRCGLSDVDPAFPRYPRLPVLRCAGHRPGPRPSRPGASRPERV